MRFALAVSYPQIESWGNERCRTELADFVQRVGARAVGDLHPVATMIESSRTLEDLRRNAGEFLVVEDLVRVDLLGRSGAVAT